MAATQIGTRQILSVNRDDMDVTTSTKSVITKVIAGTNISISQTGADNGTGDVTINVTGVPTISGTNTFTGANTFSSTNAKITIVDPAASTFTFKAGMHPDGGGGYYPGLWLNKATPSLTNYSLLGDGDNTNFNSVGPMTFRIANTTKILLQNDGNVSIANLATGLTAPTTSGTTRMVTSDANGLLSFANIPTGGGDATLAGAQTFTGAKTFNGGFSLDNLGAAPGDILTRHTTTGAISTRTPTQILGDISAEPALGNPSTNGYVLSSTTAGVRSWIAAGAGGGGDVYLANNQTFTGQNTFGGTEPMVHVRDTASTSFSLKAGVVGNAGIGYYPGIWLSKATPDIYNYAFLGDGQNTIFNSTGPMAFRIANVTKFQVTSDGIPTFSEKINLVPQTTPATLVAGDMFFDSVTQAVNVKNNVAAITLQVGQEDWVRVWNGTGATINNGAAVYINGADATNQIPTIALAKADNETTAHVAGIATHSIPTGTIGWITAFGTVRDVNTSTNTVGVVYLSHTTAGALTNTAPTFPYYKVKVGNVVVVNASTGIVHTMITMPGLPTQNYSVADQTVNANTTALLTGGQIVIPDGTLKVGTRFKFKFTVTKTAAGTAANTVFIKVGTAGTTADTSTLSFTIPAGTAVIDTGVAEIEVTLRTIGASASMVGNVNFSHNGTTAGLTNLPCVVVNASGTINTTTSNLKVSLGVTTGAQVVWTFQQVVAEIVNL